MNEPRVYLDHNASAPLLPQARAAMLAALDSGGNASSVHADGRAARKIVEDARREVAALCQAAPAHVTFTSGATEAATWLLSARWRMGRAPLAMSKLYVCATEHPCVLGGGRFAAGDVVRIGVDANGLLDLAALVDALDRHERSDGLALIAVQMANNETGVIQPMAEIAAVVTAAGGVLVVDAVQAAGRLPLDITKACGDFLILSSHKIGGPQGAGAVVARADLMMPEPLVLGGGQERGHRAGTENIAAIAGFGAAAKMAKQGLDDMDRQRDLRDAAQACVLEMFPDAIVYGAEAPRLANTLFFGIPGVKAETVQIAFDLAGVAVSAGSACSSGRVGPSHVLEAMGHAGNSGAIRMSVGRSTCDGDIGRFRKALGVFAARRNKDKAA